MHDQVFQKIPLDFNLEKVYHGFLVAIPAFFTTLVYNAAGGQNGLILNIFQSIVWLLKFPSGGFLGDTTGVGNYLLGACVNCFFYALLIETILILTASRKNGDDGQEPIVPKPE